MVSELLEENRSLIGMMAASLSVLWKEWPKMDVTTLKSYGDVVSFSLTGVCPHCSEKCVCVMVTPTYEEQITPGPLNASAAKRFAAVTQCQGCRKFVLAVVTRAAAPQPGNQPTGSFVYEAHHPMGKPDDSIGEGIPVEIGEDFKEALRCRWVNAYKATVAMCRRSLEGSCYGLKADGDTLEEQIDDLAKKGIITASLKEWARRIRLTGNRGAHAPDNEKQLQETPTEKHADAILEFTRQYFENVYTMPFKVKAFDDPQSLKAASGSA